MSEPRVVFVGKKPSYAYVKAVVMAMDEGHRHIRLQARGSAISRAVDVAEICRRRHGITASSLPLSITIDSIETSSVELKGDDDRVKTVSTITIDILGEGDMVVEEE